MEHVNCTLDGDLLELADAFIRALAYLDLDATLRDAMPITWKHATRLLKSDQPNDQLLGYSCLLTMIVTSPDAAQTLVERLRDAAAERTRESQQWAA